MDFEKQFNTIFKGFLKNVVLVLTYILLYFIGEKPFICPVCGKSFTQSGSMRFHWRKHTSRETDTQPTTKTGRTDQQTDKESEGTNTQPDKQSDGTHTQLTQQIELTDTHPLNKADATDTQPTTQTIFPYLITDEAVNGNFSTVNAEIIANNAIGLTLQK